MTTPKVAPIIIKPKIYNNLLLNYKNISLIIKMSKNIN